MDEYGHKKGTGNETAFLAKKHWLVLLIIVILAFAVIAYAQTDNSQKKVKTSTEDTNTEQVEALVSTSGVEKFTKADAARKYSLSEAQIKDEFRAAIMAQGNSFTLDELFRNGAGGSDGSYYEVNNLPEVAGGGGVFITDIKVKFNSGKNIVEFYIVNLQNLPINYHATQRVILENGRESALTSQEVTIPTRSKVKIIATEQFIRDGTEGDNKIAKLRI